MIEQAITNVLKTHCDIINARIVSRWASQKGIHGEARASPVNVEFLGNIVKATMEYSGGKAYVSEFGRGSLMDDSANNPYLNEYLRSEGFNQWRLHSSRKPIMGRNAGEYKDLDGNTHVSSGKMQGLDLERDGDPRFKPLLGQHIIHEEVTKELPEIVLHLQRVIEAQVLAELSMSIQVYI